MSLIYASGFQVGGENTMTCTVAGSAATITEGTYMPGDMWALSGAQTTLVGTFEEGGYTNFTAIVKSVFDAATSSTFTVTFSETTGKYTISRSTNFTLAFSTAADLRLRAALGFTGDKSGASTYTSDSVAKYVLVPAIQARSLSTDIHEPDDIAEESVSDGGDAFVVTRKSAERMWKWEQTMESYATVFNRAATAYTGTLWTWQDFFEHTRGTHPFAVRDSGWTSTQADDGDIFRLTAKGAAFTPKRVTSDFDDLWNIPFSARWLGYCTG